MVQILCFSAPFVLGGTSKVLLKTKPRRVGKFRGCRFLTSEKVWREKKETAAKYNGSLATLEWATIKNVLCI